MPRAATARSTTAPAGPAIKKEPDVITEARQLAVVPAGEARALTRARAFTKITDDEQLTRATAALRWLDDRIRAIKGNERLNRLIADAKKVLDGLKAVQKEPLSHYEPLARSIRDEIGRYQTARERARIATQATLTKNLTKQLTTGAKAAVEVERGDDAFEFVPVSADAGTAVTLQAPEDPNAGMRKFWRWALVNPKKPRDKEGNVIVDAEAGLLALAQAVVDGTIPPTYIQPNADVIADLCKTLEDKLAIPGVTTYFEMRPHLGDRRAR